MIVIIGTGSTILQYSDLAKQVDSTDETKTSCNKDTGEKTSLQKWSYETFIVSMEVGISTCGNHFISKINTVKVDSPLFQPFSFVRGSTVNYYSMSRSEGPAQVFFLVLTWLVGAFGSLGRIVWRK